MEREFALKSTSFNGWGVSIFDSLDTMLLMDLDDEFRRAVSHVERAEFTVPLVHPPVFLSLLNRTC